MTSQAAAQSPKKSSKSSENIYFGGGVISGAQIRAARALLRWSARELAEKCEMSPNSIQAAERTNGVPDRMLYASLLKIKTALERGGVEFGENGSLKLRPKGRK